MDEDTNSGHGDGHGLDKDARLAGQRDREAEESRPEPLDPPFPYRVEPFDPIAVRDG